MRRSGVGGMGEAGGGRHGRGGLRAARRNGWSGRPAATVQVRGDAGVLRPGGLARHGVMRCEASSEGHASESWGVRWGDA